MDRITIRRLVVVFGVALVGVPACALFGPSKEAHPDDVERPEAISTEPACDDAPVVDPVSLFAAPYRASATRPPDGSRVALDGVPASRMICSQRGCEFECCDNGCGSSADCTYALRADAYNEVCLAHADFACGGTDCSGYCKPFSTSPKGRYRFVGALRYPTTSVQPVLDVERFCALSP